MTTSRNLINISAVLFVVTLLAGCSHEEGAVPTPSAPGGGTVADVRAPVEAASKEFSSQKTFDPWVLTTTDPKGEIPAYIGNGVSGVIFWRDAATNSASIEAGQYKGGALVQTGNAIGKPLSGTGYSQSLDMQTGRLTTAWQGRSGSVQLNGQNWPALWKSGDIAIEGDPEAQQVTRANLFYLLSSIAPKSANSIPPFGLSSTLYGGHIFWDAEIWMLPALLPQYPDRAKSMIDYRFKRLDAAKSLATQHGFKGAEYPWESADTGKEEAPAEFSKERHITADVAYAAWHYYLWTGDKAYLKTEGFPVLAASADYWVSRAKKGDDGKYHIAKVLSPDETAGEVDDDAWTNGVVSESLKAAILAAAEIGQSAKPAWSEVAKGLSLAYDDKAKRYIEHVGAGDKLVAKQADTQMLIYPLDIPLTADVAGNTADFALAHTMKVGPAMTSSIDATVAARLGRGAQSLDLFHDSYRPFMRSGLDAFSEKRTANRVYFCTGMGGCLQSVIYGFGGLNLGWGAHKAHGTTVAQSDGVTLGCDPHLPTSWTSLTLKGVRFRGSVYDIHVGSGNKVTVTKGAHI